MVDRAVVWCSFPPLLLLGGIVLLLLPPTTTAQVISCTSSIDCEQNAAQGSICRKGRCSNPYEQGCLIRQSPQWKQKRVCNSDDVFDDDDDSAAVCRQPDIDYLEIRIFAQDWESATFESWLLQIILSELLGVPTTIETGLPNAANLNFYAPTDTFAYGNADDEQALTRSHVLKDCTLASRSRTNYQSCAHISPESWETNLDWQQEMVVNGTLENPTSLGVLGQESWYILKYTAQRDPSLVSYLGLQGRDNRHKLAETFLRPTTWGDYCTLVANCTTADSVAARPPLDTIEANRMFVEGLYNGHFRKTDENNCNLFPENCTGHIADYPCGWSSYVESQTHHLDIGLASSGDQPGSRGYTYAQLTEMVRAANATQSDLIFFWFTPESLYQSFLGTNAEFQRVLLPPPTQECVEARLTPIDRCSLNETERIGEPEGACDEVPRPLEKLVSTGLYRAIHDSSIPEAIRNPALPALNAFRISDLQLGELFDYWETKNTAREAVCQWAYENLDTLQSFLPRTYPRVVREAKRESGLLFASTILGSITTLLVLLTAWMAHSMREKRAVRMAQIEFLYILLAGLFTIAVGAVIVGSIPNDFTCVARVWFINLGYTMELVPLIVKVAAINRINAAASRMRRVKVNRKMLFRTVACIGFLVVLFLLCWTLIDPPGKQAEYDLSRSKTALNETIVHVRYFCDSESNAWEIAGLGWNCVLLLCATVLAFQTRKIQKDWNESQTLAIMVYSHLMFVVLRATTFALSGSVSDATLNRLRSLIFSLDTIATLVIYFVPKFVGEDARDVASTWRGSLITPIVAAQTTVRRWISSLSALSFVEDDDGDISTGRGVQTLTVDEPINPATSNLPAACPHCGRRQSAMLLPAKEDDEDSDEPRNESKSTEEEKSLENGMDKR